MDNFQILHVECHAEKSENERLSGLYRRDPCSVVSRDVLELFAMAPKPKPMVFRDGTEGCIEINAVRCRVSAMLNNKYPPNRQRPRQDRAL